MTARNIKATVLLTLCILTGGASYKSYNLGYDISSTTTKHFNEKLAFEKETSGIVTNYKKYIEEIAELNKVVNPENDVIKLFNLYTTLESNGLLSVNGIYDTVVNPYFEVPGLGGLSIPLGNGCCRNSTSNLKEILRKCGFDPIVEVGTIYENDKLIGNHTCVSIDYNGTRLLLDPTYNTILLKNGLNTFRGVTDTNKVFKVSTISNIKYSTYLDSTLDTDIYKESKTSYEDLKDEISAALSRTQLDVEYFGPTIVEIARNNIQPLAKKISDAICQKYYVDDETVAQFNVGDVDWPNKYFQSAVNGDVLGISYIDEYEYPAIIGMTK